MKLKTTKHGSNKKHNWFVYRRANKTCHYRCKETHGKALIKLLDKITSITVLLITIATFNNGTQINECLKIIMRNLCKLISPNNFIIKYNISNKFYLKKIEK